MSSLILPTPTGIAPKITRTPIDATSIQGTRSGRELRLVRSGQTRWRYQLSFSFLRSSSSWNELQALESFIQRHSGRFESFLWRDPEDYSVTAHGFGVGTGAATVFQLQRTRGGAIQDVVGTWDTYALARQNLIPYSVDYSNAGWTKNATTQAGSTIWAPDGSLNADTISDTAANSPHYIRWTGVAVSASWQYTLSIVVQKGATYDTVLWGIDSANANAIFNLATGVVASVGAGASSAAMRDLGRGWYLCSVTFTAPSSSVNPWLALNGGATYVGGAGKVNVWHSQFEPGPAVTRPIPTAGAVTLVHPTFWPATGDGFEPVTDPSPGISVYIDGVLKTPGIDYTLGAGTGLVALGAAPVVSSTLSWTGNFYKRVRFETEEYDFERIVAQLWELGTLDLISVI